MLTIDDCITALASSVERDDEEGITAATLELIALVVADLRKVSRLLQDIAVAQADLANALQDLGPLH